MSSPVESSMAVRVKPPSGTRNKVVHLSLLKLEEAGSFWGSCVGREVILRKRSKELEVGIIQRGRPSHLAAVGVAGITLKGPHYLREGGKDLGLGEREGPVPKAG